MGVAHLKDGNTSKRLFLMRSTTKNYQNHSFIVQRQKMSIKEIETAIAH